MLKHPQTKKVIKWFLIIGAIFMVIGATILIYYSTLKHEDTSLIPADFKVEALSFIKEFEKDNKAANLKYAEKIIEVTGVITSAEAADTTINIKMSDSASGSYLIFAFQKENLNEAKTLKPMDHVTIKGSCSDGIFSEILGTYFVSFKRSVIVK